MVKNPGRCAGERHLPAPDRQVLGLLLLLLLLGATTRMAETDVTDPVAESEARDPEFRLPQSLSPEAEPEGGMQEASFDSQMRATEMEALMEESERDRVPSPGGQSDSSGPSAEAGAPIRRAFCAAPKLTQSCRQETVRRIGGAAV